MTRPKARPVLRRDGNRMVCMSCFVFNCWHGRLQACDIPDCQCTIGNVREQADAYASPHDPPSHPDLLA